MTSNRTTALLATAAVGALAVLGVAAPAPAAPAPAVSAPAVAADPALPDNLTPVTGGADRSSAVPVTTGRYQDATPASTDDLRVYSVTRTIPGSVVMVGTTLLTNEVAKRNRLSVVILYPEPGGSLVRCGKAARDDDQRATAMPLITHAAYTIATRADCATRTDLLVVVFANEASGVVPGTPYELDVWEVPPVTNLDAMPEAGGTSAEAFTTTEPTTQVEPGAWKSTASLLEPDESVHVDLPVGQVSWFAVPLAFNELVDAVATISDPEGVAPGAAAEIRIVSPVGGIVGYGQLEDDLYQETATVGAEPVTLESESFLISPRQRETATNLDSFFGQGALNAEPGHYLIAVWVAGTPAADATVSMTLTPAVLPATGLFAQGDDPVYSVPPTEFPAPDGASPEEYDAPSGSAEPSEEASGGSGESPDAEASEDGEESDEAAADDGGASTILVSGLIVMAVVLAGLGVVLLVRARRA